MKRTKIETLAYCFLEKCSKEGLSKEDLQRVLEILQWEIVGKPSGATFLGRPGCMTIATETISTEKSASLRFQDLSE